ncbi:BUD13 homolog [Chelonus insularis]|uniref:BUD13 homolog n=1 Tax=Chelonus insularis TaxID=460826 RepID=UPI00158AF0B8|nr:BUD13 homolog [Chelonus insularis]
MNKMETKISQKEYLKKYLGGSNEAKKKKKKKFKIGVKKVKIIDDDVDLNNIRPVEDEEFAILNNTEDAPQIVGVVDERGPTDFSDRKKWKVIADDGEGNVAITSFNNDNTFISQKKDSFMSKDSKVKKIETSSEKTSKKRKHLDEDSSPSHKFQSEVDSDLNLPRKHKKSHHSRHNNESDSDLSPTREPRKQSYKASKSNKQYDSDMDLSQKSHRNHRTSKNRSNLDLDLSSSRKELKKTQNRDWSDSDLSPPRDSHKNSIKSSRNNRGSDSDLSPPRRYENSKKYRDVDPKCKPSHKSSRMSPRRTRNHHEKLDSNYNSYRKSHNKSIRNPKSRESDSDLSPPRHSRSESNNFRHSSKLPESSRHERRLSESRQSKLDRYRNKSRSPENHRQLKKTLDGKTAGLQNAQDLREETMAHKKREAELFRQMDSETSGVGQAAVLRDKKTGKRRNLEAEAAEREEKEKRQKEIDEKYARWGKGLKQVDDRMEKLKDDLYEMSKPLARYADDADLDARLRAVEREGDPMLEYIKKKQIKEGKRQPDEPSYQGSFMPNRFGIRPGHRWDGVDRSNGYEKKWFEAQNAKAAIQEEAYKWSTSDM